MKNLITVCTKVGCSVWEDDESGKPAVQISPVFSDMVEAINFIEERKHKRNLVRGSVDYVVALEHQNEHLKKVVTSLQNKLKELSK